MAQCHTSRNHLSAGEYDPVNRTVNSHFLRIRLCDTKQGQVRAIRFLSTLRAVEVQIREAPISFSDSMFSGFSVPGDLNVNRCSHKFLRTQPTQYFYSNHE